MNNKIKLIIRITALFVILFANSNSALADVERVTDFTVSSASSFRDHGGFYDSVNKKYLFTSDNGKQGKVTYVDEVTHAVSTVNFKGLGEAAGQTNNSNWNVSITSFWQDPATGNIRAAGFSSDVPGTNLKAVYWLDENTPVAIDVSNIGTNTGAYFILAQAMNGAAVGFLGGNPVLFSANNLTAVILDPGLDSNGLQLRGSAKGISDNGSVISASLTNGQNDVPTYFVNQQIKLPNLEGNYIEYGNFNAVSGDGKILGGTIVTNPDIDPNADFHGVLVSTETNKVIQDFGAGSEVIDVITDPTSGYFAAAINFTDGSTPKLFVENFGLKLVTDIFPAFTGNRIIDLIPGSVTIVSNTGFVGKSKIEPVIVQTAPTITSHPANTIARLNQAAQFSVVATGTDLQYQWQKKNATVGTSGANSFVNAPGASATTANYSYTPTATSDNGAKFKCVVSNTLGTAISNEASLTLDLRPAIDSEPQDAIVGLNKQVTFNMTASGPNLRYQWKKNGSNISGATTTAYRYTPRTYNDEGIKFSCEVSNTAGKVSSRNAILHVQDPPKITSQSGDARGNLRTAIGNRLTLFVNASGAIATQLKYQWKKNGMAISGATSRTYVFTVATGDVDSNYSCTVSNLVGSTDSRLIKIIAPPVINPQPQDRTIRRGNSALFSVTAQGGSSLRYQWYRNSSSISGATSSTYQTPVMTSTGTSRFSVRVSNNSATANSRNATLNVHNN